MMVVAEVLPRDRVDLREEDWFRFREMNLRSDHRDGGDDGQRKSHGVSATEVLENRGRCLRLLRGKF